MSRIVYGLRPVEELLRAKRSVSALFVEGSTPPGLHDLLKAASISPVVRTREELDELAGGKLHQGVVAVTGEYPYVESRAIVDAAFAVEESPLVLILDGVQDPQNLGAIARSAHLLGAHGIVIPKDRAAGVTSAAVKASAGATEHVRIAQVTNIARTIDELKERGIWVVGTAMEGGVPPWELDLAQPTAIVLGAEGKGVRPLVLRGCDHKVMIPMSGKVASFNVAAAGAMLLYEALRQRNTTSQKT